MSDIKDLTVNELIHILQGTYHAIDLRAMLLKERTGWNCIFFVLRMTIQDKVKLNSLYETKRSLMTDGHPDVQIVYESREPAKINAIIGQIKNGIIYLESYSKHGKLKRFRKIDREKTRTSNSYALSEDIGFPHKVLVVPYDAITSPQTRLENHGVEASDLNLKWIGDLKSCFDVSNLYDPYYLILVFPVYARVLECRPNKLEKKLDLKVQIHEILFPKSKIRVEVRSDHKLIDNPVVHVQPDDIKKEANGILTVSISEEIPSFVNGTSGTLRTIHEKLGELAFQNFNLPVEAVPSDFGNMDMSELVSGELPPLSVDYQLNNLLKETGIDYNLSTREIKITTDDYTLPLPLSKDILIDLKFGNAFYDNLKREINLVYKFGLYTSAAVLSRKLIENLLIEVLRKKYPPNKPRNLNLYYVKKKRRHHDFAILLDNLEKKKSSFGVDVDMVSKFISLAKPFRPATNATAHSIIEESNKDEIVKHKIPQMISLLKTLKENLST